MGVGPPRFGLRPGTGKRPGIDQALLHAERRTIHYPGLAVFPGRAQYPFRAWIRFPSTTKYPSTDLSIRGAVEALSGIVSTSGVGLTTILRSSIGYHRTVSTEGGGTSHMSGVLRGPSALIGKIHTAVEYSRPDVSLSFEAPNLPVRFSGLVRIHTVEMERS